MNSFKDVLSITPLINHQGNICISLYMPAHRSGLETQQDPIRLRNLMGQAATRLVQANMSSEEISALLAPASDLLEKSDFWQHQSDGLALFMGKNFFQYHRLPWEFNEFVSVSPTFYIKPLVQFLTGFGSYYILAASQNQIRVFQADGLSIEQLEPASIPTSLSEALRYDDPEQQLQLHSGHSNGNTPLYHGQGADDQKTDILRFFQAVDRGLRSSLTITHRPLIFVGVDYLFPIYQQANSYPTLLDNSVQANPDMMSPQTLHQQTWPLAQNYFEQTPRRHKSRYLELAGSAYTSDRLIDILNAAHDGQVETLFVVSGQQHRWGIYDATSRQVVKRDDDDLTSDSLLNLAIVYTLNCGGEVFVMDIEDMPSNTLAAAILRYPMAKQLVSIV